MPTHVATLIKIKGDLKDIELFLKRVKSNISDFDFNNIMPIPSPAECGGYKDIERWKEGNWGTKEAYDIKIEKKGDVVQVRFNTEWYPPIPIYTMMSRQNKELTFYITFAGDDDYDEGFGALKMMNGVDIEPVEIKSKSKEAYRLVLETTSCNSDLSIIELIAYEDEVVDNKALALIDIVFEDRAIDEELPLFAIEKLEEMAVEQEDFEYAIQLRDLKKK